MRVVFFGSSSFSCAILAALRKSVHEVVCVVTQPDMPAGRSMKLTPTEVCGEAQAHGLPVLKPSRLKGNLEFVETLRGYAPDALMTASYGQIIPRAILELNEWPLNVHPSLLPKLRGASPIRTALLQGLEVTGCCIMRMTPRLDDGDVLSSQELSIEATWNHADLESALGVLGGKMAVEALDSITNGTVCLRPQNHSAASYCKEYRRDDARIDWLRSAADLNSFVRAWDPDIGAWTTLPDSRRLKIWRAVTCDSGTQMHVAPGIPGELQRISASRLAVMCTDGWLEILELQPENKRRMSAADFLAGSNLQDGSVLS